MWHSVIDNINYGVESQDIGVLWGEVVSWSRHGLVVLFHNLWADDLRVFIL